VEIFLILFEFSQIFFHVHNGVVAHICVFEKNAEYSIKVKYLHLFPAARICTRV